MQFQACGTFPSKDAFALPEFVTVQAFPHNVRPIDRVLHTFCGQQCAQALSATLKCLILKHKSLPAF
jgi:hypothetical protein